MILLVIILFVFALVLLLFPMVRLILFHPFKVLYNIVRDFIKFFKECRFNIASTGHIICYCGLFGKGKTLSAVARVVDYYNRYNDVTIFDLGRMKFVKQKVHILSNVDLIVPFEPLVSLEQIVWITEKYKQFDIDNNIRTVHLCLIDEASVQLNSRDWKKNIDALFLNTVLTCRHHYIEIILTAQRFNHLDSLLRQVCTTVIQVNKKWRFQLLNYYDAYALEHASNPDMIKPYFKTGFFVDDKHYGYYDTLACVGNLKKDFKNGNRLTEKEILELQQSKNVIQENNEKRGIFK